MKTLIAVVMFLSVAALALAQEAPDASKSPPATKLEAFSARTGIVLIKAFSTVGSVRGMGNVDIDVREFRDASNPKLREYGISIAVKESGRLERESTSYIDFDEIDSLLAGIEYISKIDKSITTMKEFEAEYRTKGYFAITTFSSRSGEISVAVSSGRIGRTAAYLKLADLNQIKTLITEAKVKINAAKLAGK